MKIGIFFLVGLVLYAGVVIYHNEKAIQSLQDQRDARCPRPRDANEAVISYFNGDCQAVDITKWRRNQGPQG